MSKINWQQPYVNTFKHFTINSDKNVVKHGEITSQLDNQIKQSVYKITGSSSFITIPKLTGQSLGLTGRYIYFLFKPIPNKLFSLHVDLETSEKLILRVSFSNQFKEFKSTSTWLQFPFVIQAPKGSVYEKTELAAKDLSGSAPPITKWSILCIDLIGLTQSYSNRTYHSVRGFKLCSNMLIKNVITSDILYEPGLNYAEARLRNGIAFPRELAYPCEKYENWHQLYDYVSFPSESFKRPFDSVGQSKIITNINQLTNEPRLATVKQVYKTTQHTAINSLINQTKNSDQIKQIVTTLPIVGVQTEEIKSQNELNFVSPDDFDKQNQHDIHVYPFKSGHDLVRSSSSSQSSLCLQDTSDIEVKVDNDYETKSFKTTLEPDPILRLNKIIGFGSRNISNNTIFSASNNLNNFTNILKWSMDSNYLVYACQAIVVAYHLNSSTQYCFVGHSDRVSCITLSPDNSILASGQAGQYSLVRLWDFQTRKCLSIFRNHDHSLYLLEFSYCGNYLCGVGKDKQGKTMLVLWDVKNFRNFKTKTTNDNFVKQIAKAHTDVQINRIMFVHYDSTRLITCGKDNVKFWRLKNDTLRSCSVNLSPYTQSMNIKLSEDEQSNDENSDEDDLKFINKRDNKKQNQSLEFTDICMNSRLGNNDNLVYACTKTGQIFIFNIAKMEVENVRVLEPIIKKTGILQQNYQVSLSLKLNSLTVSDSLCVTGSDDGFVRIWPLDFSQVSVEAEHEAPIGVVRFSSDCMKIASATLNGNLGILDVNQKEYQTLIRSHTDSIVDISIDPSNKYIGTCSLDSTVRVWNLENFKQLYDFSAPNERPTCLNFHPNGINSSADSSKKSLFACGFNSGKIRIFNLTDAKLLNEIKSPHLKNSDLLTISNSSSNIVNSLVLSKYEITDLKYSNNGKRLVSADAMRCLCLYDSERDYSLLRLLPNSITVFGSLSISFDHKYLAIIGPSDYLISIYESFNLNECLRINILTNTNTNDQNDDVNNLNPQSKTESAIQISFAPNDLNQIVCVTSSNRLIKFDYKTGRYLSTVQRIHKTRTDCLKVSDDARFLISSGDNSVKVWDYEMRLDKNYQTFIGHSSPVNKILLTNENKTLITIGDSILFWDFLAYFPINDKNKIDMPTGRELNEIKTNIIRESNVKKVKNAKLKEKKSYLNPDINDYNEITILNENSFNKMLPIEQENNQFKINWDENVENISFEQPRKPPVAANFNIQTISANDSIEDTFLNEDLSINDESNSNQTIKISLKKFNNLPNLLNEQTDKNFQNGKIIEAEYKTLDNDIKLEEFTNSMRPNIIKHLNSRKKESILAKKRYAAPETKCGIKLNSVIGYNGKYSCENMIWNPEREFFAFTIGSIISVEDLKTGEQKILHAHHEDITVLTLRNDNTQMASASSYLLNIKIQNNNEIIESSTPKCQIVVWDCMKFEKIANLFHKNASNITCMNFSSDDRFLVSISDYLCPSLTIWRTFDYSILLTIDSLNYIINDIAWNPFKCNEFMMSGLNKTLVNCFIDEKPLKNSSLNFNELDIPLVLSELNDKFDFTTLAYGDNYLLFAATNFGFVTVWNCRTNTCFLNWRADTCEIDVLVSVKNKLITGSSKGNLKLWNISSINELRTGEKKEKQDGLIIENEINLHGAIKCSKFDALLDIGILGTNKGTIWYVNWHEESSVRLVSTHTAKINNIMCVEDKYLSTVSDDGSLNIWSISDRERIVQFEVKSEALCQAVINCDENLFKIITNYSKKICSSNQLIIVGYSDGSIRLYDIDKKKLVKKLKPINHGISSIKYCENTHFILAGSIEGVILVIDLDKGVATRNINDHKGASITNLDSFYRDDKKITYWLASSRDRKVSVWNSKWNEDVFQMVDWLTFQAPSFSECDKSGSLSKNWLKYPPSLAYFEPSTKSKSTDTLLYVGYGLNKQILFYNFIKKQMIRTMELSEWSECMAVSPKFNLIAFGTKSRLLQIKDYNQATFQDYSQHSDTVSSVCFSNDGKKLFSTSFNEIFIWDVNV